MSPLPEHMVETSLVVSDLERARSFYERVFGLQSVISEDGLAGLQLPDGSVLLLFASAASAGAARVAPSPHLRFGVPSEKLQDWDRHLMMNGVVVESRVRGRDGASSLFFRDPDQNSLEVASEAG